MSSNEHRTCTCTRTRTRTLTTTITFTPPTNNTTLILTLLASRLLVRLVLLFVAPKLSGLIAK